MKPACDAVQLPWILRKVTICLQPLPRPDMHGHAGVGAG